MIEVNLDTSAIEHKLNRMYWKVQRLGRRQIGMELSQWQIEDVHRSRPFTKRNRRAMRVATLFRPHSRYEMKGRKKITRKALRRAKKLGQGVYIRRWSTRPILRAEMIERLHQRIHGLVNEKLKWE